PPVQEKPQDGVHDFVVKTWHLTDAGNTLMDSLLKKDSKQLPFIDPRPRLRLGQKAMIEKMNQTRRALGELKDKTSAFEYDSDRLRDEIAFGTDPKLVDDEDTLKKRISALGTRPNSIGAAAAR